MPVLGVRLKVTIITVQRSATGIIGDGSKGSGGGGAYPPSSERVPPLGILVPSFQTKALIVPPVDGDNCRIFPPNCMVGLSSIF